MLPETRQVISGQVWPRTADPGQVGEREENAAFSQCLLIITIMEEPILHLSDIWIFSRDGGLDLGANVYFYACLMFLFHLNAFKVQC